MSEENSTTTYGIRMKEKVKEEIQKLAEDYSRDTNSTVGDFVEVLLATYKVNKLVDAKSDIAELNQLTSRIYNLYVNLLERNETNISNVKVDFQEQLSESETQAKNMKVELEKEKQIVSNLRESLEFVQNEYQGVVEEYKKIKSNLDKSDKLISKLEEENDNLKKINNENKNMRVQFDKLEEDLKHHEEEIFRSDEIIKNKDAEIENIVNSIDKIKLMHCEELEKLKSSLEFGYQQKTLEIQQNYQNVIQEKENEIISIKNRHIEDKQTLQDKCNDTIEENRELKDIIKELKAKLNEK